METGLRFQQDARADIKNCVDAGKRKNLRVAAIPEMEMAGKKQTLDVQLTLSNSNVAEDYDIIIGTPIGLASEYLAIPLSSTFPNIMFGGLADLSDQQGVGLPYLQELNNRIVRHALYISYIEVLTEDNTVGQSQKSEQVTYFEVPLNSFSDSSKSSGNYIPNYTEYNAVTILGSGMIVGEFNGFAYKLLAQSTVRLNIHLAAIDAPTFIY